MEVVLPSAVTNKLFVIPKDNFLVQVGTLAHDEKLELLVPPQYLLQMNNNNFIVPQDTTV